MEFHPDYSKLNRIGNIMSEISPLQKRIDSLNAQIEKNNKVIRSKANYTVTPSHHNYEQAVAKESARVGALERQKRKRRMASLVMLSLVLQIALLIGMVVLLLPNFPFLMLEPMLLSAVLVGVVHLAHQEAINQNVGKLQFGKISYMAGGVLIIVYAVMSLVTFIPELPSFEDLSKLISGISAPPLVLGAAQALLAIIFVRIGKSICKKVHVNVDYEVLDKARAADERADKKREDDVKAQHVKKQNDAAAENRKLQLQIAQLQNEINPKLAEAQSIGILDPSEYKHAWRYSTLIYNETMATGRQVDLNWARWKQGQEEMQFQAMAAVAAAQRDQQRLNEMLYSGERLNQVLTDAYRREDERQARADLKRQLDSATEAVRDLEKALRG